MNQRIKKLRKVLDLTQQEFAERIGSVQNTITGYETGRRGPSNQVVTLICREFGVNEAWLRTGDGEMFIKRTANDEISAFVDLALCDEPGNIRYRFLSALAAMSEEELQAATRFALALAK
ncbi:MAG: helix-turn-helix transcriptional regulator [Oscillospiraceae bacterium]|nr:helix-turn-helix transcriptional regulator [Oscillospiraceae bacterium]